MSNAAHKSKTMQREGEPASAAIRRSFVTLTEMFLCCGQSANQTSTVILAEVVS